MNDYKIRPAILKCYNTAYTHQNTAYKHQNARDDKFPRCDLQIRNNIITT